jgi:hypothetical protein
LEQVEEIQLLEALLLLREVMAEEQEPQVVALEEKMEHHFLQVLI